MTGKHTNNVCLTCNNARITTSTTPKEHTVIQIIIILQCNCLSRFYWGKLESVYGPLKTIGFLGTPTTRRPKMLAIRHYGYLNTDTKSSYTY